MDELFKLDCPEGYLDLDALRDRDSGKPGGRVGGHEHAHLVLSPDLHRNWAVATARSQGTLAPLSRLLVSNIFRAFTVRAQETFDKSRALTISVPSMIWVSEQKCYWQACEPSRREDLAAAAVGLYLNRSEGLYLASGQSHSDGYWHPLPTEWQTCCREPKVQPSDKDPLSLMAHTKTLQHCACYMGVTLDAAEEVNGRLWIPSGLRHGLMKLAEDRVGES